MTGRPRRLGALRDVFGGISAISVKELRGRMRGKRAFVIITIHLLLVAGFAWMVETLMERTFTGGFGSTFSASAEIGRALFIAMLVLLTLIVLVLAPASTAGAISLEREKQTLDLLATTPISSLAIVLGKLLSALSWILLLLLASIPVTALVFTFGGVAPDDMARGYVVLLVTALFYGSVGLFVSALVKRTQAATVINLVTVIALTAGTGFLFIFWSSMTANGFLPNGARDVGVIESLGRRPPEALLWFNPFIAQLDVVCGTETGFGSSCQVIGAITNNQGGFIDNGLGNGFGVPRDSYWPRACAAMAIVSLILIVVSVQLVSPTRRWRIRLPRSRPRPAGSDA
ncbi:MAG TPA: ABC transporter permease subunit [Candidatus Limnocylindrales bacterium]|nr:ABC transporter permease subunit [Candidatus Limnocylindrales bacterium]